MASNIRSKVVAAGRAAVGYQRKSSRWNKFAAKLYPTVQYQAYCGVGATSAIYDAGVDVRDVVWMPYVPYIVSWAKKHGAWKTSGQRDGDLVCYDWGGDGLADHVGIAWRDEGASGYRAIEYNTSGSSAGSQSNGGGVHVRYRGRKSIMGWVDLDKLVTAPGAKPVGSSTPPATKPTSSKASGALDTDGRLGRKTAQEIQQRLRTRDLDLDVDGKIGPATIRAMQAFLRSEYIDGEISHQPKGAKDLGNGYRKDCIKVGDGSSPFVKRWQAYVGAKVDGRLGEKTIKATQVYANKSKDAFTAKDDATVDARIKKAKL